MEAMENYPLKQLHGRYKITIAKYEITKNLLKIQVHTEIILLDFTILKTHIEHTSEKKIYQ